MDGSWANARGKRALSSWLCDGLFKYLYPYHMLAVFFSSGRTDYFPFLSILQSFHRSYVSEFSIILTDNRSIKPLTYYRGHLVSSLLATWFQYSQFSNTIRYQQEHTAQSLLYIEVMSFRRVLWFVLSHFHFCWSYSKPLKHFKNTFQISLTNPVGYASSFVRGTETIWIVEIFIDTTWVLDKPPSVVL